MILSIDELNTLKNRLGQDANDFKFDESYAKLRWASGIHPNDSKKTVAGMLAVMYQFRNAPEPAIAAAQWRITKDIVDDQGQPGHIFFELGADCVLD